MPASKSASASIDPDIVRELAAILRETDLSEIEVEVQRGELRLRIARTSGQAAPVVYQQAAPALQPAYAAPAGAPASGPAAAAHGAPGEGRKREGGVPSPMVGTAYLSPEPGAAPFVKVGDTVSEGQTLMIVEAMKTMNPIPAPRAGKVVEVLVFDAQPVEYGEPLLVLE
jgi:acetyl-CoA carboxylase biotin carboxyl carrier protein